ncbi:MAG: hypothetical protein ACREQ3_27650 [Candidatus Binatia bacterium]
MANNVNSGTTTGVAVCLTVDDHPVFDRVAEIDQAPRARDCRLLISHRCVSPFSDGQRDLRREQLMTR